MNGKGLGAALAASVFLSGCGGGMFGQGTTASTASGGGMSLSNLLAYNSLRAPAATPGAGAPPVRVDCPEVQVLDGTAAYTVYNGADRSNGAVRYQYSLGDVARQCTVEGNQISIKVGVEGRVLLGPAGTPGSFSVPVRVVVRRESDRGPAASKLFTASAAVPTGDTQATFDVISDPLLVPLTGEHADQDYTIYVGFDNATPKSVAQPPARRRG